MKLNALMDNFGARKDTKRIGRGIGSGYGKTAGRGNKGQKARSGSRKQATFQGGQMPIMRRFPKFGFNNPFAKTYATVNLGDIEKFISAGKIDAKAPITIESLISAKIVNREKSGLKVLAKGEIKTAVNIVAGKWSKAAEAAIVKVGGSVTATEVKAPKVEKKAPLTAEQKKAKAAKRK
jgi:large subunit ribosomal protein L15